MALLQRAGHLRMGVFQVTATVGNPNHLALALVALLPAGLWLFRTSGAGRVPSRPRPLQVLALALVVLVVLGILATRCQAAWLALAVAAVAAVALWPLRSMAHRVLAVLSALGAAGAAALWLLPGQSILAAAQGRAVITRMGLAVVAEAPLGGVGLGGFGHHVAWVQGDRLAVGPGAYSFLLDAHNQMVMMASETGAVGLVLGLVALVLALRPICYRRRAPEAHAALVAWVALAVFSFSETAFRDVGVWLVGVSWLALGRGPVLASVKAREPASGRLERAWRAIEDHGAWRLAPSLCAALAALVTVSDAAADHLHARGLSRIGRTGEWADDPSSSKEALQKALGHYDRALTLSLDPAALHLDRALVLQALARSGEAAKSARSAFEARPGPDRALVVGDLAAAVNRPEEAVLWYQKAVRLHPRYARARNNLGVALVRAGDPQGGCGSLRRALSLLPFDKTIRKNWQTLCKPPEAPPSRQGTRGHLESVPRH